MRNIYQHLCSRQAAAFGCPGLAVESAASTIVFAEHDRGADAGMYAWMLPQAISLREVTVIGAPPS